MSKITAKEVKKTGFRVLGDCTEWELFTVECMAEDGEIVYARDIGICIYPMEKPNFESVCRCVEKQLSAELTNKDALIKAWKTEWRN